VIVADEKSVFVLKRKEIVSGRAFRKFELFFDCQFFIRISDQVEKIAEGPESVAGFIPDDSVGVGKVEIVEILFPEVNPKFSVVA